MSQFKVGIIGGTGLEDPQILEDAQQAYVPTPYGDPSDLLTTGRIGGVPCILLSRHGRRHQHSPTAVNYRANIWALKSLGASVVIASSACGSLREEIKPGDIVVLDSFIDRTTKRDKTFYDDKEGHPKGVCHIPMHPSFNDKLRSTIMESAEEMGISLHKKGTSVCIEGPAYSSRAESNLYRQWGGYTINMTNCPEVYLCKELALPFAIVAIVTDYDCWRDNFEAVTVEMVTKTLEENSSKLQKLFVKTVERIYTKRDAIAADIAEDKKMAKEAVMGAGDLSHI